MTRARSAWETWSYRLWAAIVLVLFLGIAVAPIGLAFWNSIRDDEGFTFAAYSHVFTQERQWTLLCNTLTISGGSAALATVIGAAFAVALEYIRTPARGPLLYAGVVPLIVPGYITTIAWVDLFGVNGLLQRGAQIAFHREWTPPSLNTAPGAILILGLSYYPVVLLTTRLALRRLDERFEEAACLASGRRSAFRRIVLPQLAPSIAAGSLVVFLLSLVNFAIPSLLQVNVYAVEVFTTFSAFYDSSAATAQSLPLVVCGVVALGIGALYIGPRRGWLSGAARERRAPRGGRLLRGSASVACWLVVALSSVAPMVVLVWRSWPLDSYREAFVTARGEILTSLVVAGAAATLITVFGASLAHIGIRGAASSGLGAVGRIVFPALCVAPFLISGPVLAIALIAMWNRPGPMGMVYDSILIVVFACTARFTFFAERGMSEALADLHPGLTEAAHVFGIPWWRQALGILLPLTWPVIVGVWGLAFVFTMGEVDATALLCPPGHSTVTMRLFSLMHYGPSPMVAALSVITVALVMACGLITAGAYTYSVRLMAARLRGAHARD